MVNENPNLIPPPSIGESKASLAGSPKVEKSKRSKLWMVVVGCIVAGIGLGVFVYQQSIAPSPKTTPRPTVTPRPSVIPTPAVSPSPVIPEVSVVTPQNNTITFPKAGQVRVYFALYGANPALLNHLIRLSTSTGEADVVMPGSVPSGDKMVTRDSGLTVTAGQAVTIQSFDRGNMSQPSHGWISPPSPNKCGTGAGKDIAPYTAWATQKATGEPLVSIQCWSDWNQPNDTTARTFDEFLVILSYVPGAQATASPSVSPSVAPSTQVSASPAASKTPSPSPSKTPTPTPTGSKSPSPSPTTSTVTQTTPTPSASARVTMPEGSALPDAGVFEVTAGTMGFALIFILLGLLGLLLL